MTIASEVGIIEIRKPIGPAAGRLLGGRWFAGSELVSAGEVANQFRVAEAQGQGVVLLHVVSHGGSMDETGKIIDAIADFQSQGGYVVAFGGRRMGEQGSNAINSNAPLILIAADLALMQESATIFAHGVNGPAKKLMDGWSLELLRQRTNIADDFAARFLALRDGDGVCMDASSARAMGLVDGVCWYESAEIIAQRMVSGVQPRIVSDRYKDKAAPERWRDFVLRAFAGAAVVAAACAPQGDAYNANEGNSSANIPSSYPSGQQTNQSPDNLWPNGNSEYSPPSDAVVKNDGSQSEWDYRLNVSNQCSFTASISGAGANMNVSAVASGALRVGQRIDGAGIPPGTFISALGTGTGGPGTYALNQQLTISSESMTASGAFAGDWVRHLDNGAGASSLNFVKQVPCAAGEAFYLEAQMQLVGAHGSGIGQIAVNYVDAAGNFLAQAGESNGTSSTAPSGWILQVANRPNGVTVAPPGAAFAQAILGVSPGCVVDVDAIVFRRVPSPSMNVGVVSVPYSASMTFDARAGTDFLIVANNGTAFTINAPTNLAPGQIFTLTIENTSGGALGAATFASPFFKLASWTQPGSGNNRSITFRYNGSNAVEISRTPSDVPN